MKTEYLVGIPSKSGIYRITCTANGKIYIGSSINIRSRVQHHASTLRNKKHHSYHLQRAHDKYGGDSIEFTVIELCEKSMLLDREQYYLDKTQCYKRDIGFNISPDVNHHIVMYGKHHTDKTKKRISIANSGRIPSEKTRKKMSIANSNPSEETRRKLSIANSGKNNPFYGKSHTEETKRKISEANSNPSEEIRRKISENRTYLYGKENPSYGIHRSEETKRKISENMPDKSGEKAYWYGKKLSEEHRLNARDALREYHREQFRLHDEEVGQLRLF